MECIILAGGLGTRLQSVIGAYPKCMATVNGEPFLYFVFQYLRSQNCKHVILSLGYKHEVILDWLYTINHPFIIDYVIETQPLGTGGGIQLALNKAKTNNVFVLNGDTLFFSSFAEQFDIHLKNNATTTLALKQLQNFDRYGVVKINNSGLITQFEEKHFTENGYINGGVYIIQKSSFFDKKLPEKFSFEKDYLEKFVDENRFYGYCNNNYFIDIGIPTDYEKAQEDLKHIFP